MRYPSAILFLISVFLAAPSPANPPDPGAMDFSTGFMEPEKKEKEKEEKGAKKEDPVVVKPVTQSDGTATTDSGGSNLTQAPPPVQKPPVPDQKPPEETHAKVMDRLDAGDKKGAWAAVQEGLKADPQDEKLQAVAKLLDRHVTDGPGDAALKAKAAGLLASRQEAGAAKGAVLASPVAWPGRAASPPVSAAQDARDRLQNDIARQGLLKINMKDYRGAERDLTWRLEKNPSDWLAWRLRALTRHRLKNYQGGYEDATRAIALNPKDGWAYKIRSTNLLELGRPKLAIDDAERAIALDPNDAGALVSRAQALSTLGREAESLADLERAAGLDAQFASLYTEALSSASPRPRFARSKALYGAAAGLSLLIFSLVLIKKRAAQTARRAMRATDRAAALETPAGGAPKGFRVLKRLGQGGMGVVYEAEDLNLARKVALKRMRDEIAADPRERRRFLREARTVASLKHPNIVEIYSVLEQADALYLVFEHLSGRPLDQVLGEKRALPPAQALALLRQMAAALDYAHAQGVVHQDLKPANVMISGDAAKVTDFGIARSVKDTLSTVGRQEVVGTPAYMAPEQEQGISGKEADLFALGVCAYELIGGRRPFAEGSALMQKLQMAFQPLSALSPSFPKDLDSVLARALNPDPLKRFPSARELYAALEHTF